MTITFTPGWDMAPTTHTDPAGPRVRVVGPRGTDIVNHSGYAPFVLREHGGFDVPIEVANALCAGVAGFVRQERTDGEILRDVARLVATLTPALRDPLISAIVALLPDAGNDLSAARLQFTLPPSPTT